MGVVRDDLVGEGGSNGGEDVVWDDWVDGKI